MKKKPAKKKTKRFLWVIDPWETLDHANDTTLLLAKKAILLGHRSSVCEGMSVRTENDRVALDYFDLQLDPSAPGGVVRGPRLNGKPSDFNQLHYRTDPPVDMSYLHPLQMLYRDQGRAYELVNPAESLVLLSEKLEGAQLQGLAPRSLCASGRFSLEAFIHQEQVVVAKPLHQAQSKGVVQLRTRADGTIDTETIAALSELTENFTRPTLLQEYLPEILTEGEIRLWFLDGKLLATIRKRPLEGDFRVLVDQGSRLEAVRLGKAEKKAALLIGKQLKKRRVRLAAVDLVRGKITDFNVTSPGLLVQMEKILKQDLSGKIIRALLKPNPLRS